MLTSSSPARDKDCPCKTALSRREYVLSCISVTIVDRAATPALPLSGLKPGVSPKESR
jgi:hypothetical protein